MRPDTVLSVVMTQALFQYQTSRTISPQSGARQAQQHPLSYHTPRPSQSIFTALQGAKSWARQRRACSHSAFPHQRLIGMAIQANARGEERGEEAKERQWWEEIKSPETNPTIYPFPLPRRMVPILKEKELEMLSKFFRITQERKDLKARL